MGSFLEFNVHLLINGEGTLDTWYCITMFTFTRIQCALVSMKGLVQRILLLVGMLCEHMFS